MTLVLIDLRSVYGRTVAYPANDQAARVAAIAGTKTLNRTDLLLATGLDLDVRDVHNRDWREELK